MSLHGRENQDDVARGYWRSTLVLDPPLIEGMVWLNEKALFGRRGLCKRVADIRAKNEEVLGSSDGVKEMRACLVGTICIDLV